MASELQCCQPVAGDWGLGNRTKSCHFQWLKVQHRIKNDDKNDDKNELLPINIRSEYIIE